MTTKEELILVTPDDKEVGFLEKIQSHLGFGITHRAFSILLFNSRGDILIQKRSGKKMLWPAFWSNTCCSHPRRNEATTEAAKRRLFEETGIRTDLRFLYKFHYRAAYKNIGTEDEVCHVFVGKYDNEIRPDPDEIMDWKYISLPELRRDVQEHPDRYTPWFAMELAKLDEMGFRPDAI